MRNGLAVGAMILLASCVAPREAPPPPAPPLPRPAPPPPAPPADSDWRYAPLTPGTWSYRPSTASYGTPGAPPALILRCVAATRTIAIAWPGAPPAGGNRATITTTETRQAIGGSGAPDLDAGYTGVTLPASSRLLDQMAYSRGRLMIEHGPSGAVLIVPAWPEIARVIEDCRK